MMTTPHKMMLHLAVKLDLLVVVQKASPSHTFCNQISTKVIVCINKPIEQRIDGFFIVIPYLWIAITCVMFNIVNLRTTKVKIATNT